METVIWPAQSYCGAGGLANPEHQTRVSWLLCCSLGFWGEGWLLWPTLSYSMALRRAFVLTVHFIGGCFEEGISDPGY